MKVSKLKKFNLISICFLLIFSIVTIGEAAAKTYYVCNSATTCNAGSSGWSTGTDSNTGLSRSQAFKTPQKCADTVTAGDICVIGDGTYTGSYSAITIKRSGTA